MADYDKRIKDLVSVVISTYNYQSYILEILDSLAKQTYPDNMNDFIFLKDIMKDIVNYGYIAQQLYTDIDYYSR